MGSAPEIIHVEKLHRGTTSSSDHPCAPSPAANTHTASCSRTSFPLRSTPPTCPSLPLGSRQMFVGRSEARGWHLCWSFNSPILSCRWDFIPMAVCVCGDSCATLHCHHVVSSKHCVNRNHQVVDLLCQKCINVENVLNSSVTEAPNSSMVHY
ncbi:hypothetical protein XENOCAPTIV_011945 [Xenoophorus captivus]|uniref:Uncharacterized protein n=1 Tax=Xenoophorus captivus TaxID=1517983 RepID=A0ABV0Q5S3_9TELE